MLGLTIEDAPVGHYGIGAVKFRGQAHHGFVRVKDHKAIVKLLRDNMLCPPNPTKRVPYIAAINQRGGSMWNGQRIGSGGHTIEGPMVLSMCYYELGRRRRVTLTWNGTSPSGSIMLRDIVYIDLLCH